MSNGFHVNVGSGEYPLSGFVNIDQDRRMPAEIHQRVPPLPFEDGDVGEVYAGHFLEHLTPKDANLFLSECYRVLVPGGKLGILVPDTREVVRRYLAGEGTMEYPVGKHRPMADLDEVCAVFLYSTVQKSPHRWSYDLETLRRRLLRAGFYPTAEIDRYSDPRIPVGGWWQCGWDAVKPGGEA